MLEIWHIRPNGFQETNKPHCYRWNRVTVKWTLKRNYSLEDHEFAFKPDRIPILVVPSEPGSTVDYCFKSVRA